MLAWLVVSMVVTYIRQYSYICDWSPLVKKYGKKFSNIMLLWVL